MTTTNTGYWADDGNAAVFFADAESGYEAAKDYVEGGDWPSTDDEGNPASFAVRVHTWRERDDDDGETEVYDEDNHLIVTHPDEPDCPESPSGHNWESPHELVGGCDSNPGVWGIGGCGVKCTEVCTHCGMAKHETSATQGVDTEHDHETVSYEEDFVDAEALAEWKVTA